MSEAKARMPWEDNAKERLDLILDCAEFDEKRGIVWISAHPDDERNTESFSSLDELMVQLEMIADGAWNEFAPFEGGVPVFEPATEDMVTNAIESHGIIDFFEDFEASKDNAELLARRDDLLVKPDAIRIIRIDFVEITDELIRHLAKHPEKMRDLKPRKFEELVAELFRAKGYDVQLTPPTRDGGYDIRAVQKSALGSVLVLIECKRNEEGNKVGVGVVRSPTVSSRTKMRQRV